ncbi:MAG: EamA family transporter [Candidatus Binatia bacterium]
MPAQLIALFTAIFYASALVSARRGLKYSTPITVTCVSVIVQTVTLWTAIFLTGGIPEVSPIAVLLFLFVGMTQLGVRLLAFTGVHKIGASRSSSLQAASPLIAAMIAIAILHEKPSLTVVVGTLLVVIGIILVSWRPERQIPTFRWWHLLLPICAAVLTGINHPIRRYALSLSNESLFFAAIMGSASLAGFVGYLILSPINEPLVWNRRAVWPFIMTGLFETLSILFIVTALSLGTVVVVAPIASTYPVWALIGTVVFLRDLEQVKLLTIMGSLIVVTGTIAIHLGN